MKFFQTKIIYRSLATFWLFGAATVARAHDLYLSYTDVWLHPDRMEVKCSLACFTALLLDNPNPTNVLPVLDEDNFGSSVPALKQDGEKLFEVTEGGTNLVARAVDVQLSSEGDAVDFTIIYPRPPAGPLRIAPAYVKRLPDDGFGTALVVFDEAGNQIAFDDNLNLENLNLDLKVPPPIQADTNTGPQAAASPAASDTLPPSNSK
jgi:hypothetical protein